ncbi:MAG: IS66 family insertion sequence element accessory protein TnpB [Terriglobales bacterium]
MRPGLRFLVTSRPVVFRRGLDALAALVKEALQADPFASDIFVFRPKRAGRPKILVRDGSGLVLLGKRIERGRFTWPQVTPHREEFTSRPNRPATSAACPKTYRVNA